jgi:hypothetical protein
MKLQLKKISEEKFDVIIIDNENNIVFNDQRYYNYMGEEMVNNQTIDDTINQLSSLFGNFDTIENDFNV